jgi:predicted ABC-type ATPase
VTITGQLAGPAALIGAQAIDAAPDSDDPTAVAMFTAHRLDEIAQQLAHATERMQAARAASGDLRAYHSGHVARHLAGALDAGRLLAANLRAHYPAEGAELDKTTETIGLAKALSEDAKAATTAHLLQTVMYDAGHASRHAQAMLGEPAPDVWGFNADHAEKHLGGAAEHVRKLAVHLHDNYPDEGRWLARLATITEQMTGPGKDEAALAGTITGQLIDLGRWDGWRHEPRDAHGRWARTPGSRAAAKAAPWHQDGDVMHYHGHLGIDRADMPQVSGILADGRYAPSSEMMPKFLDRLKAKGVKVTHERVPARSLKPTQTTGDARAVRGIADSLGSRELKDTKPVLVSSDNRVIDGHHQWAAHVLGESEGKRTGSAPGEPVIRADMPADKLMAEARQFAKEQGIQNRKTGVAANPKYAKPSVAAQAAPKDTLKKYQRPDGTFTPERAALHKKIIDGILAGHSPQAHPVATFFGGGPAAGKSTALKATHEDSVHVDPDEIKAQLPEYQQMLDAGDPKAAAYVHEESSYLAKQAVKEAQRRRLNLTWDGTGDSHIDKLAGKVNDAKRHGYMTEGKYVTVDTDEAVRRAQARAEATGRHVPETFIRETHAAVSDAYAKAAKMGLFDKTELWDTSGKTPVLVAHKDPGGKFTVHDPAAWQRFLDKAGEGA